MLLEIQNIVKSFGGLIALADVSFTVWEGEILGLIGPNGSGKTTVFNVISGFYRPDRGHVHFRGADITGRRADVISRMGLVRTFQIPKPLAELTVIENLRIAAFMKYPAMRAATKKALQIYERVGLSRVGNIPTYKLTYGQKKILELGRALATEPKLLCLDEVMAGLNSAETMETANLLRRLQDEKLSLILVEHNMDAVLTIADRIVVLNFGNKIADGLPKEVMNSETVIEAYLGRDGI